MERKSIDLSTMVNKDEEFELVFPNGQKCIINKGAKPQDPFDFVPKSWEEIVEKYNIDREDSHRLFDYTYFENTEEQEAFIALAQLRLLWHDWVKVLGHPEPCKPYDKYTIIWDYKEEKAKAVHNSYDAMGALSFLHKEHAEKFIECFPELLEKAKILL